MYSALAICGEAAVITYFIPFVVCGFSPSLLLSKMSHAPPGYGPPAPVNPDSRPLPEGWTQQYDSKYVLFVDIQSSSADQFRSPLRFLIAKPQCLVRPNL